MWRVLHNWVTFINYTRDRALVLRSQTAFFLLHLDGKKGSGTMTKDFLFRLPPGLWWVMISDNDNL